MSKPRLIHVRNSPAVVALNPQALVLHALCSSGNTVSVVDVDVEADQDTPWEMMQWNPEWDKTCGSMPFCRKEQFLFQYMQISSNLS